MTLQLEHALVGCLIADIPWSAFLKAHFHILYKNKAFKFTSFTVYFSHPAYRMRVQISFHIFSAEIYSLIRFRKSRLAAACWERRMNKTKSEFRRSKMKYLMQLVSLFTDLDECEEIDFICGLDGICINKNGTYDCVCPEGQTRNPNDGRCEGTLYKSEN